MHLESANRTLNSFQSICDYLPLFEFGGRELLDGGQRWHFAALAAVTAIVGVTVRPRFLVQTAVDQYVRTFNVTTRFGAWSQHASRIVRTYWG